MSVVLWKIALQSKMLLLEFVTGCNYGNILLLIMPLQVAKLCTAVSELEGEREELISSQNQIPKKSRLAKTPFSSEVIYGSMMHCF